jgi:hypothetical protein
MTSRVLSQGMKAHNRSDVLSKKKNGVEEPLVKANIDSKSAVKLSIPEEFKLLDRYWKASNYLSVGQVSQ